MNQAFAKKFFNDEDPIGKHFGFYIYRKQVGKFEIVGVTEDTKYGEPTKNIPCQCSFCLRRRALAFLIRLLIIRRFGAFEDASHILNAVELSTLRQSSGP